MPTRNSQANWRGTLKEGEGTLTLASGAYDGPFTFKSRFEDGAGTNPEEMLGAALAGCYTMALNNRLFQNGAEPVHVHSTAQVSLEKGDAGFAISHIHLLVDANVPGMSEADFAAHAEETRKTCIIARAIAAPITVETRLL